MRDQIVQVQTRDGSLDVVVKGDALELLREGHVFQDGASLMTHYRSVIAEIAREKHAELGRSTMQVVLTGSDFAD